MLPDLPPDYYRNNFLTLLDGVGTLYADLLTSDETQFYQDFIALSDDAQKLYVRLVMRKGPLFRSDTLCYPEIPTLTAAASELAEKNFLAIDTEVPVTVLLNLLKNSELCEQGDINPKLRRPAILESALEADIDWPERIKPLFHWYMPLRFDLFQSYLLFFFGNLHQDLTEFVLSDLEQVRFERYRIDSTQRFFRHRQDWQDYADYYRAHAHWELCDSQNPADIEQLFTLLPMYSDAPLLQEKLHRFALRLARQLERLDHWDSALAMYSRIPLVAALERRARIHHQRGEIDTALALCVQITEQSTIDAELQFAHRFYHKLAKQIELHQPVLTTLKNKRIKASEITIPVDGAVETAARDYYAKLDSTAASYYVENILFNALFGLAFWDIIFADIAGVFLNPFQQAPKDIFSPHFVQRRQQAIDERLNLFKAEGIAATVLQHFVEKNGLANRFVNWSLVDIELLQRSFTHIPNAHLLGVFEHMLKDLRHYRSGFPDLIIFKENGSYELIEIKAPGDRIQANQTAWMKQFAKIGIPHSLVNVKWQTSPTTTALIEAEETLER